MRNWSEKKLSQKEEKNDPDRKSIGKKSKKQKKKYDTRWHMMIRTLSRSGAARTHWQRQESTRSLPPQQIEVIFHLSGMHFSFSRKIWYIYQYCWCCFLIKWTSPKWLWLKATSTKIFDATWWSRFASKACRAIWEPRMQWYFRRWKVDSKFMYNDE